MDHVLVYLGNGEYACLECGQKTNKARVTSFLRKECVGIDPPAKKDEEDKE